MTQKEALAYLEPFDDDPFEKWEEELFEIRQQILDKSHVPALLNKRKERLLIWKEVGEVLAFDVDQKVPNIQLKPLKSELIIEAFQAFQTNEAQIKKQLFFQLSVWNLIHCTDLFQENLKSWFECLPKWTSKEKVIVGTKPDVMLLLQECQQLSERNIKYFQQLKTDNCPPVLLSEILRLNSLFNS